MLVPRGRRGMGRVQRRCNAPQKFLHKIMKVSKTGKDVLPFMEDVFK